MTPPSDFSIVDETVLKMDVVTENLANIDKLGFKWYVTSFTSTVCTIQLEWENPPWVSSTIVRDQLTMQVLDTSKLLDTRRRQLSSDSGGGGISIPP